MAVSFDQAVIDTSDAAALAGFWAAVLDRTVAEGANQFFANLPAPPGQTSLMFITVPEAKQVKNRMHIDLAVAEGDDPQTELKRILDLGAVQIGEHHEYGVHWVCLKDPEGNEFDLALAH